MSIARINEMTEENFEISLHEKIYHKLSISLIQLLILFIIMYIVQTRSLLLIFVRQGVLFFVTFTLSLSHDSVEYHKRVEYHETSEYLETVALRVCVEYRETVEYHETVALHDSVAYYEN